MEASDKVSVFSDAVRSYFEKTDTDAQIEYAIVGYLKMKNYSYEAISTNEVNDILKRGPEYGKRLFDEKHLLESRYRELADDKDLALPYLSGRVMEGISSPSKRSDAYASLMKVENLSLTLIEEYESEMRHCHNRIREYLRIMTCISVLPMYLQEIIDKIYVKRMNLDAICESIPGQYGDPLDERTVKRRHAAALKRIVSLYNQKLTNDEIRKREAFSMIQES